MTKGQKDVPFHQNHREQAKFRYVGGGGGGGVELPPKPEEFTLESSAESQESTPLEKKTTLIIDPLSESLAIVPPQPKTSSSG